MAYNAIDQGISNLYSVTTPGQTSAQVKALQEALIQAGYDIPAGATGFYGSQTKAALEQWKARVSQGGTQGAKTQEQEIQEKINQLKEKVKAAQAAGLGPQDQIPESKGTKTNPDQPLPDAEYEAGVVNNPINAERIAKGNSSEALQYAATSGDLSQLVNEYGQPFSLQEQQDALAQGMEDNKLFYENKQAKEKADTESALAQKQADYQKNLADSKISFESDKASLDQNAANQGVLFSGSRVQKEQNLQKSYEQDQASKLASYGRDVGNIARDYQYAYGDNAAGGLSQFYNASSNTYNPNVATGGVGIGGISSVYNPSSNNFGAGTVMGERSSLAKEYAAKKLANKGNKLLSTSYNNQF